MIYPDVPASEWAQRYNIPIKSRECVKCGATFEANIPFAIGGYRGFIAPVHECGEKYRFSTMIPVGKDEIKFWLEFKYGN